MDTVTESHLAIALAQQGGIGIIHRNMSIERQAEEVDRVKRSESGMIVDPITIGPDQKISDAQQVMSRYRISGVPVTEGTRPRWNSTNRDLRFENRSDVPIRDVMTKDNLITVAVGTTLEEAEAILIVTDYTRSLKVGGHTELAGVSGGSILPGGIPDNPAGVHIYRIRRDWKTADLRGEVSQLLGVSVPNVTDAEVAGLREQ